MTCYKYKKNYILKYPDGSHIIFARWTSSSSTEEDHLLLRKQRRTQKARRTPPKNGNYLEVETPLRVTQKTKKCLRTGRLRFALIFKKNMSRKHAKHRVSRGYVILTYSLKWTRLDIYIYINHVHCWLALLHIHWLMPPHYMHCGKWTNYHAGSPVVNVRACAEKWGVAALRWHHCTVGSFQRNPECFNIIRNLVVSTFKLLNVKLRCKSKGRVLFFSGRNMYLEHVQTWSSPSRKKVTFGDPRNVTSRKRQKTLMAPHGRFSSGWELPTARLGLCWGSKMFKTVHHLLAKTWSVAEFAGRLQKEN